MYITIQKCKWKRCKIYHKRKSFMHDNYSNKLIMRWYCHEHFESQSVNKMNSIDIYNHLKLKCKPNEQVSSMPLI